ncbi:MAG: DUF2203 family protein [Planctomycetaceae bacterium]
MVFSSIVLSVEDANRRLPLVSAIVRDAMSLKVDVLQRQERLQEVRGAYSVRADDGSPYSDELLSIEQCVEEDRDQIDAFAEELQQLGANLVDALIGLVEFHSLRDGELVLLSWMFGETDVSYWRRLDDDPLDRHLLESVEQVAG